MNKIKIYAIIIFFSFFLLSCNNTEVVGSGVKGYEVVSEKEVRLFVFIPLKEPDTKKMAGYSLDYTITRKQTFFDNMVTYLSGNNIYCQTVEVKK
jgi:hypothetical protein